jgi:hypothetical protein
MPPGAMQQLQASIGIGKKVVEFAGHNDPLSVI